MNITETLIYKFIQHHLAELQIMVFKSGQFIERATHETRNIYYILQGTIRVQNSSYTGNKILVDELSSDEFVGHISNLYGQDFHCDILAKTSCTVLQIPPSAFDQLMQNAEFVSLFYTKTSKRIYCMYKRLLLERLFPHEEIVAHYIMEHTHENVFIYKSMYEICEALSISRRGLYNILNKLILEGYLEKQEHLLIIKDRKYLMALASNIYDFYNELI